MEILEDSFDPRWIETHPVSHPLPENADADAGNGERFDVCRMGWEGRRGGAVFNPDGLMPFLGKKPKGAGLTAACQLFHLFPLSPFICFICFSCRKLSKEGKMKKKKKRGGKKKVWPEFFRRNQLFSAIALSG